MKFEIGSYYMFPRPIRSGGNLFFKVVKTSPGRVYIEKYAESKKFMYDFLSHQEFFFEESAMGEFSKEISERTLKLLLL